MTVLFEPWLQFQHAAVRQLAFTIASPNILRELPKQLTVVHAFELHNDQFWQKQYQRYEPRLQQLDQNPDELLQFLAQLKSTRLGLRFEYLMWFWLQDSLFHDFELIGHSIQIIDAKNTLGELDFLVWNKSTTQIEHWEVALKFYLAEGLLDLPQWYGLNRSDTLNRKLNHFSQKQFQFKSAQGHAIHRRYAVLKGQLYIPLVENMTQVPHSLPHWMNPARRMGHWGNQVLTGYYRLERQEWICAQHVQSSPNATWWYNGLYRNQVTQHDYMFRQAEYLKCSVRIM